MRPIPRPGDNVDDRPGKVQSIGAASASATPTSKTSHEILAKPIKGCRADPVRVVKQLALCPVEVADNAMHGPVHVDVKADRLSRIAEAEQRGGGRARSVYRLEVPAALDKAMGNAVAVHIKAGELAGGVSV